MTKEKISFSAFGYKTLRDSEMARATGGIIKVIGANTYKEALDTIVIKRMTDVKYITIQRYVKEPGDKYAYAKGYIMYKKVKGKHIIYEDKRR